MIVTARATAARLGEREMRIIARGLAAAAVALALGTGVALAEPQVTLSSLDGATKVEGELVGFDGKTYSVRTKLGTISIAADQVSCAGPGCPRDVNYGENFGIAGSNVIGEGLMPVLIQGYSDAVNAQLERQVGGEELQRVFRLFGADGREMATISVEATGTEGAFSALASGAVALGLAARRATAEDPAGAEIIDAAHEHILALDGIIVIVHPDNPVKALTLDQIAGIFSGRITSWAQLGGPAQSITLYLPGERSATRNVFEARVMAPRRLTIVSGTENLASNSELSDLVSIDPTGIGITGFAFARAARPLAIRQECGLISAPTAFSMKTEEYPLGRRLYAYESGAALPSHANALLDFALSDAAQPLIAEAGFVDREIEGQGIDVQGMRLANSLTSPEEFSLPLMREMLTELKEAERLSITFRFTAGSTDLEPRSQSEAERFAGLLASGKFAGKDVLLVGFADSIGDFEVNRSLAERRARSVLDTLTAAVPQGALEGAPVLVKSYGELTPVGCNETAEGRELNRRVEVWVRGHKS